MSVRGDDLFTIADILDSQLISKDGKELGRVADVEAQWDDDGKLVLTVLVTGPQALAGRVLRPLRSLLQWWLHDCFERTIPLCEVEEFGPTLRLFQYPQMDRRKSENSMPLPTMPVMSDITRKTPNTSSDFVREEWNGRRAHAIKIFISDLLGCKIVTAEGQCLGRVMDIQLSEGPEYAVTALMFGRGALMHRWHVLNPFQTHKEQVVRIYCVPWEAVGTLEKAVIRLKADVGEEIPINMSKLRGLEKKFSTYGTRKNS
jgi:sporulation protein YlmC with PRC-barrel domain